MQETRISPWRTRNLAALASVFVSLLAVACSDYSSSTTYPTGSRTVVTVTVAPGGRTLIVGDTLNLSARATDATDYVIEGRPVSWLSTDDAIATVSAAGVVKAIKPGTVTIRATVDGKTGAANLSVEALNPVGVASIAVTPVALLLDIGQTRQLTALVFDAVGNRLTDRTVTWSSDSPEVAAVGSTGLITAKGHGYATITATCEGKTFSLAVTVTDGD